ncbi:hypothetical protein GCM10007989_24890 [Devosia pacifica]|uniref:DUF4168 domain-containing protein n=1 Tax=Devosia pacifica TaxID=1335967 RepID=A0A918S7L9_9HYPH|nr:DUF4168 domain-containing protein [Devosia pacifica]GHA27964.1 hypothetical protein GCM10007989_24890 [Devosia pacifica]
MQANKTVKSAIVTALSVAMLGSVAAPALAQGMVEQAPATTTAQSADFSDETISAFAAAYIEVVQIGQGMQEELQGAQSAEDQQAIMQAANEEIETAVEGTPGIAVDEYNEILQVAQADDALIERINAALADLQPAMSQ